MEKFKNGRILRGNFIFVLVSGFLLLLMLLTLEYEDHIVWTIWSTNILDVIAQGDITEFYNYTALNLHDIWGQYCGWTFFQLIPMAMWNIPIWFLQYFFGVEIAKNSWCLLWSKGFLVLMLLLLLFYSYRITFLFTGDKKKGTCCTVLILSSVYILLGIGYSGQNDIVWVMLGAGAIYYALNDKTLLFLLMGALSIACKPFFIMPAIAVVLLREKRILRIGLQILGMLSVLGLTTVITYMMPGYTESVANGVGGVMMDGYFSYSLFGGPYGNVSLLFLIIGLLYVYCYFKEFEDIRSRNEWIVYSCFAVNILWLLMAYEHYYRTIMVVPYIFILFCIKDNIFEMNLFLEILFSGLMLLVYILTGTTIFTCSWTMPNAVINLMEYGGNIRYDSIWLLLQNISVLDKIRILVVTSYVIVGITLCVVNFPDISGKIRNRLKKSRNILVLGHVLVIVPFLLVMYACALGIF